MNPEISGLIRHALTVVGAMLVTKGYLDDATFQTILGGVVALGSVLWSLYAKRGTSSEAAKIADKVPATGP